MKTILAFAISATLAALVFVGGSQKQPEPNFRQGLWVVQYNASFNKKNDYAWQNSAFVRYHYVDLDKRPEFKKLANIHSLPTLILYKDGKEVKRWEADITFKLATNQKEIISATK
jgi:hypothetical protein